MTITSYQIGYVVFTYVIIVFCVRLCFHCLFIEAGVKLSITPSFQHDYGVSILSAYV